MPCRSARPNRKSVFGKLIDLWASVTDPKIRLGVVQQRVE